ncbi:MAG: hypothetical protein GY725_06510 [bacterium]|nr:hypothetical protein [bacterium]
MSEREAAIQQAMLASDAYMKAWNARDQEGMADACNFPHVRIASGQVRIWPARADSIVPGLFDYMVEQGWHHSEWGHRKVVHAGTDKVHLDVEFNRYRADGSTIGVYPSLWVMTLQDGKWGIQARSSYAA